MGPLEEVEIVVLSDAIVVDARSVVDDETVEEVVVELAIEVTVVDDRLAEGEDRDGGSHGSSDDECAVEENHWGRRDNDGTNARNEPS